MSFNFDNSFARLPKRFYSNQLPARVSAPAIIKINNALATEIGVGEEILTADILAGNEIPDGAEPIAMAYAGHQFGGWNPQLGDGRAILLGEVVGPDGVRRDIQLKGSGQTMFSRNGDGRATLGAVLREYLVSEAMAALGLPTTRALAAVTTGEQIMREGYEPGAVLTRVAQSHIRVGTFQFYYARQDTEALQLLTEHVIARHYPEAAKSDNPARAILEAIVVRQAELVARWMLLGFIHGVMNTDNSAVSGETIDYGPCAFMDVFHPETVFSSIDRQGRYAWQNQPEIAHWNMAQLAQALIPVLGENAETEAQEALELFAPKFSGTFYKGFAAKIGMHGDTAKNRALVTDLMGVMAQGGVDFTLFFRRLTSGVGSGNFSDVRSMFSNTEIIDSWIEKWDHAGAELTAMQNANPIFIPRNHRVEEAIVAANTGDLEPFNRLHDVLSKPYVEQPQNTEYENAPKPDEVVHATFCGT